MMRAPQQIAAFQETVWEHGRAHHRSMPWRDNTDMYVVLVSEMMLQQTGVARVLPKFQDFVRRFPTLKDLARAPLSEVLKAWSGLGYNRRAKFLWQSARLLAERGDRQPLTLDELVALPGIGHNTAGAIVAYSYNQPVVFVETNIRTVYFHHFWPGQTEVTDRDLRAVVAQTLDRDHPREWYWALMDYGTYLKATTGGHLRTSAHYKKQSRFTGSLRQTRGAIIRELLDGPLDEKVLQQNLTQDHAARFASALGDLLAEQMVVRVLDGRLGLTDQPSTSHNARQA